MVPENLVGPAASEPLDPVGRLIRWERSGGHWRVLDQRDGAVTVSLTTCDGGEEMERVTSADADLLRFLDGRTSSER